MSQGSEYHLSVRATLQYRNQSKEVSKRSYIQDVNHQLADHAGVSADQLAKETDIVVLPCGLIKDLPVGSWVARMPIGNLQTHLRLQTQLGLAQVHLWLASNMFRAITFRFALNTLRACSFSTGP